MGLIRFPIWVWGSTSLPFEPPELRYKIFQKYPNMACDRTSEHHDFRKRISRADWVLVSIGYPALPRVTGKQAENRKFSLYSVAQCCFRGFPVAISISVL